MMEKEIPGYIKKQMESLALENDMNTLRERVAYSVSVTMSLKEYLTRCNSMGWNKEIETLLQKLTLASGSVLKMSEGISLTTRSESFQLIDFPSAFVVTRSIVEAYLTLEYLFIDKCSRDEKEFRYRLWELSGLLTRQNMDDHDIPALREKKQKERLQIQELREKLQEMTYFKNLSPKKKKDLVGKIEKFGKARLLSWHKLIEKSLLNTDIFSNFYSLFSNYAHAEYLSILQMQQSDWTKASEQTDKSLTICFKLIEFVHVLCIDWLVKQYPEAQYITKNLPEGYIIAKDILTTLASHNSSR